MGRFETSIWSINFRSVKVILIPNKAMETISEAPEDVSFGIIMVIGNLAGEGQRKR